MMYKITSIPNLTFRSKYVYGTSCDKLHGKYSISLCRLKATSVYLCWGVHNTLYSVVSSCYEVFLSNFHELFWCLDGVFFRFTAEQTLLKSGGTRNFSALLEKSNGRCFAVASVASGVAHSSSHGRRDRQLDL